VSSQAGAWYWLDQVADIWIPYSETDAEKLETAHFSLSKGEVTVDVDWDHKTTPRRPRHRVHMTPMDDNGGNVSFKFVERAILYEDQKGTGHRSRRVNQAESEHGKFLRRRD
jgi:hypothetical protein